MNKEVKSLEESLKILGYYKNTLNEEEFKNIISTISSHAIEGQFANEENVLDLITLEKGRLTTEELIEVIKKRYRYE